MRQREREIKDSESKREVEREGEKEIEGVERERLSLKKIFFCLMYLLLLAVLGLISVLTIW